MKRKYQANRLFTPNNPLSPRICPELAVEIGLNESIVLLQMEFWLATEGKEHGGHLWVRKPEREIQRTFPFWGVATVHRTIETLVKKTFVVKNENLDDGPGKGAGWFRFNESALHSLRSVKVCSILEQGAEPVERSKMEHDPLQNGAAALQNGATVLISKNDLQESKNLAQALRAARAADIRRLMAFLSRGIRGPIPAPQAQAGAINWLLESGYTVDECEGCLTWLREQRWRTVTVSWCTVKSDISNYLTRDQKYEATQGNSRADINKPFKTKNPQ